MLIKRILDVSLKEKNGNEIFSQTITVNSIAYNKDKKIGKIGGLKKNFYENCLDKNTKGGYITLQMKGTRDKRKMPPKVKSVSGSPYRLISEYFRKFIMPYMNSQLTKSQLIEIRILTKFIVEKEFPESLSAFYRDWTVVGPYLNVKSYDQWLSCRQYLPMMTSSIFFSINMINRISQVFRDLLFFVEWQPKSLKRSELRQLISKSCSEYGLPNSLNKKMASILRKSKYPRKTTSGVPIPIGTKKEKFIFPWLKKATKKSIVDKEVSIYIPNNQKKGGKKNIRSLKGFRLPYREYKRILNEFRILPDEIQVENVRQTDFTIDKVNYPNIRDYQAEIFYIIKHIITELYQQSIDFSSKEWNLLWPIINHLDTEKKMSGMLVSDYPQIDERITLIGATIIDIITQTLLEGKTPDHTELMKKIGKNTEFYLKKREFPETLQSEFSSLALESIKELGIVKGEGKTSENITPQKKEEVSSESLNKEKEFKSEPLSEPLEPGDGKAGEKNDEPEMELESHSDSGIDEIVEEKKEYRVYSHMSPKGKSISNSELKPLKDEYEPDNDKHLFFIYYDTEKQGFFNIGNPFCISPPCIKLLKLLLINANNFVLLKTIFKEIAGFGIMREKLNRKEKNRIHITKTRLIKATLRKIYDYIESQDNYGYKFKIEKGIKFFLVEDFDRDE